MSQATVMVKTEPENAKSDLRFEEIAFSLLDPDKKVLDLTHPQPWKTHFSQGHYKLKIMGHGRPNTKLIVWIDDIEILNFPVEQDGVIYLQKYFNLS